MILLSIFKFPDFYRFSRFFHVVWQPCIHAGGAVLWMIMKQKCVVLSTTEVEYEGAKEAIWVH